MIRDIGDEGNKYLEILQVCKIQNKRMKEIVKEEYLRRVKAVARSKLYSRNLMTTINVWDVSVVRYSGGVIEWTKAELQQ